MAAYAALLSLSNTIDRLLNHNRLSISLEENQQLLSLLEHVTSFEAFLENFPDKFNSLEGRMGDLAHEAEDIIEYFMLDQVSSWPDYKTERAVLGFKQVTENIDLFVKEMMEMNDNSSSIEGVECRADSSSSICKDAMVGFEDFVIDIKDRLCSGEPAKFQVIPICGMAGTGKTILARNIYHDPSIVEHFVIRVWVTISQYSSVERTLSSLLECLKEFNTCGLGLGQSDEEKVYQILRGRRYLVVLDSIWSSKAWDVVRRVFPDDGNGSHVMLTTRLLDVASYPDPSRKFYEMGLLSEDQSWNLLKKKVFADEDCPPELENIGKEIARLCKGWPLAVRAIAEILYTITRSDRSWEKISEVFFEELDLEKVISSLVHDSRCHPSGKHELQLKKVISDIDLVATEVKKIKDSSISSSKDIERGGADSSDALVSSFTALPIRKDVMVGFQDNMLDIKDRLYGGPSRLQVIPICGMGGIGKTTLARNVYDDALIMEKFDVRVWVTVSQDYSAQGIFSSILKSLEEYGKYVKGQDDEKVHKILMGRKYLVVMDDMWNTEAWDIVRRVFPDDGNASRVMLTTRLEDVASYPDTSSKRHEMSLLNADQSWDLFKQKVFADENCPSELENIGKEIARSCKGLPLAIVVIAGLLSMASKNPVSWMEIAGKVKYAETPEHNRIEEILSLSYVQLPRYLRPCFLYMGFFPEDDEIDVKKLIRLWIAEGFIKSPTDSDSFEKVAEEYLEGLVKRNLVLVTRLKWDGRIKSCSLHDLMRDLCIRKSQECKFFFSMIDRCIGKERFIEKVRNQRRVWVNSSNLHFFSSLQGSSIHSIICSPENVGRGLDSFESVRLLRVFDAEPLDVDDLPRSVHLHELFHMRYLAFRFDGYVPTSIFMLQNLQTLIIHDDYEYQTAYDLKLMWCMSQLRHVHFLGKIQFDYPDEEACPLENLQTLSYLSPRSCIERILKMMPNLKKLKIYCSDDDLSEAGPDCLNSLVHLHRLEDLEIFVGGPGRKQPEFFEITFPRSLKKLSLKKLEFPWNDMFVVGSLPNLQVLKLKKCTCVGGTWETIEGPFPALQVLLIESSSFEDWITESSHFPRLKHMLIHNCRHLNGIPNDIGEIPTLELIRVTGEAKKSLVESVEQIREEQEDLGNTLQVSIRFKIQGEGDDDDDSNDDDDDDDNDDEDEDDDDDY